MQNLPEPTGYIPAEVQCGQRALQLKKYGWMLAVLALALLAFVAGGILTGAASAASPTNPKSTAPAKSGNEDTHPSVSGKITSISGTTLIIQSKDKAVTVKITADTRFVNKATGTSGTLKDLHVGMLVAATGTQNSDGSLTATVVTVIPKDQGNNKDDVPAGSISSIQGTTIILAQAKTHKSLTIKTSASTSFFDNLTGKNITLSSLKVGDLVFVKGQVNSDGSITASAVVLGSPEQKTPDGTTVTGRITALNGTTISIDNDKLHIIKTTASTTFGSKIDGKTITLADLHVGASIAAQGKINGSDTLDAVIVAIIPAQTK